MRIGHDNYYQCPSCGNILKNRSLMSGNTFGAKHYSDGRRISPMLPDIPDLTKCPQCETILWLSDLKKLGEQNKDADRAEHLELHDLWRALEQSNEKHREIFIRQRIWWKYNIYGFETTDEIDDWRQNCLDLLALLDANDNSQRCMVAELYRNLCNFSMCLKLIQDLPENYNSFKNKTIEECKNRNPLTVLLNEKKGQSQKRESELTAPIEQSKNTLDFYLPLAEKCNAEAQYVVGMLYLDRRFYNLSEALRWLEYAAFQGHKKAILELEDLKNDDDGRYDAWS